MKILACFIYFRKKYIKLNIFAWLKPYLSNFSFYYWLYKKMNIDSLRLENITKFYLFYK
jgi:hypothetical protein